MRHRTKEINRHEAITPTAPCSLLIFYPLHLMIMCLNSLSDDYVLQELGRLREESAKELADLKTTSRWAQLRH
jgi:hypothetical protein